jgi:hypothetical protein
MVEVFGIPYIVEFNLQKHTYMEYEGHMEKFQHDRAFSTTYEFHTPSGIKKIKYVDLHTYIPLDMQTAIETKERTKAASYKEHKTLESYQYGDLIKYFPDEKDKWKIVKETKGGQSGYGYETWVVAKYERISQGGGRRKQPKKGSRKAKLRANSTRRR